MLNPKVNNVNFCFSFEANREKIFAYKLGKKLKILENIN